MTSIRSGRGVRLLLALLWLGGAWAGRAAEALPAEPKLPWSRIVMIGASATAGFTITPTDTNQHLLRLSRYVDAAIIPPHEPVRNLANFLLYMNPEASAQTQIEAAVAAKPTMVIGVDFLFWFCYGNGPTDRERLRRFESALKRLEVFQCPLILGDIPDASAAVDTMLMAHQIPSAKAMAAANQRLKEWAAARPHVVLVPLASFMRASMVDQPLVTRGHTIPAGRTRALLQDDKLHPTPQGAAALAVAILDAFQTSQPKLATNEVRWNPEEVFRLGSQSAAKPTKN